MRSAVRNLRRAETLEHQPRHLPVRWLRAAALAALLVGAGLFLRAGGPAVERPAASASANTAVSTATVLDLSHLPLIEDVDVSLGSVIQLVDDEMAVVVVEMGEHSDV